MNRKKEESVKIEYFIENIVKLKFNKSLYCKGKIGVMKCGYKRRNSLYI